MSRKKSEGSKPPIVTKHPRTDGSMGIPLSQGGESNTPTNVEVAPSPRCSLCDPFQKSRLNHAFRIMVENTSRNDRVKAIVNDEVAKLRNDHAPEIVPKNKVPKRGFRLLASSGYSYLNLHGEVWKTSLGAAVMPATTEVIVYQEVNHSGESATNRYGEQLEQLHKALLSAFPRRILLERLLFFRFSLSLQEIADGNNQADRVFDLIRWATAHGKVEELAWKAHQEVPGNPLLSEYITKYLDQQKTLGTGVDQPNNAEPPAPLHVVLASPFSEFAVARARANGVTYNHWEDKAPPASLWRFRDLKNVKIRVTELPINCSLFFTRDIVLYDPYLWGKPAPHLATENNFWVFEFKNPPDETRDKDYDCYELLEKHFQFLWDNGITLEEFLGTDNTRYEERKRDFVTKVS